MNYRQNSSSFFSSLPPMGPINKAFCLLSILISVFGAALERKTGWGLSALVLKGNWLFDLEFWRPLTYIFVESSPFGLFLGIFIFWLFAKSYEARWGSRDFLKFIITCALGAALISVPLSYLVSFLLFVNDTGYAEGSGAIIDALLVHLALTLPESRILLGFILPIKAKHVIWIILGIELLFAIQTGASGISTSLGGMLMGYLLTTGKWRPSFWWGQMHHRRKRAKFYSIPGLDPENNDSKLN